MPSKLLWLDEVCSTADEGSSPGDKKSDRAFHDAGARQVRYWPPSEIHWYLFQDVFPWAGELRLVGLAKIGGAPFANPQFITSSLATLFLELKSENLLKGSARDVFARRGAYYWGELNAIHPFREGNGRTQREFLRQLARHAGHTLSWADLQQEENTAASILSHTRGDHSGLERMMLIGIRVAAGTGQA